MTRSLVSLGLILAACTGCSEAPAQERRPRWEHAVFEHARFYGGAERERFRWITAAARLESESLQPVWAAAGGEGTPKHDEAGQMQVLDLLATQGWELVNGSDTSIVFAGGSAFANRYYLRRKK